MTTQPRSLRRRLKKRWADVIEKPFQKDRTVSEFAQTVSSSLTTMANVGKGTLPDTVATTPRSPPISFEPQAKLATGSDIDQIQGNAITGAATAENQESSPSGTTSARIPLEDNSRAVTLQNMPDNETAPQLVSSLNTRRVAVNSVESLTANGPATVGTVPIPPDDTIFTDGQPTYSESEVFTALAQQGVTSEQLANSSQDSTPSPQPCDTNTESAMTLPRGAASMQLHAAAPQNVQPTCTSDGRALAAAEPTPLESLRYSERTPILTNTANKLKAENLKGYHELETMIARVLESPSEGPDFLSQLQPASKSSKQITARFKRWLPTLAAVRGIGMSIAAMDPHKIAPIICASVFFSIDVSNCFSSRIRLTKVDYFQQHESRGQRQDFRHSV